MKKKKLEDASVFEYKMKRYKQRRAIIIVLVCIAVLAFGFYFVNKLLVKNYNSFEIVNSKEREDSNTVQYISYDHKLIKYSRDGISALSANGKSLWNASYDIKNPKVVVCEKYVAVADIGGKQAYTYNSKGTAYQLTTTLPIIDVSVSHQGVICVTLEGEDYNHIQYYDSNTGKNLVDKKTFVQTNGYPVDIGIATDARKMVCSYVRIENGVLESDIAFYNYTNVGDNFEEHFVGGVKDQQSVVHDVVFLNKNAVLLCSDKGFKLYEMLEIPYETLTKTFDEEMDSMFYTDKYFGFIIRSSGSEDVKQLLLYNLKGKCILKKDITFDYTTVQMSGEDIIFNTETEIRIMKIDGQLKFNYSLETPILSIMPCNDKDEYILINDQSIDHIKLVEEKKK
ncbi:DUF5711 family protein [Anaerosporobacter sp.]|uniref:DUF5711 family protein n=1 Tax=Anaerosporobacter sp. TaxID=1872529 RepID=UPI00286FAB0A|nr:DUF5711 family protein [Anaerosporobacter sp.]